MGRWFAVKRWSGFAVAVTLAACGETPEPPTSAIGPGGPPAPPETTDAPRLSVLEFPEPPRDAPSVLAYGAEPDWTVEIAEGWVVLIRPGLQPIEQPHTEPVRDAGQIGIETADFSLTILEEPCEGPNGEARPLTAQLTYQMIDYRGCAEEWAGPDQESDMAADLDDLIETP